MRSKALQTAASLLRQQAYSSGFRGLSTSSQAAFPLVPGQDNGKQTQQPALPASLPTMLRPSKKQNVLGAFQQQQVRLMAGGPPSTNTTTENTWAIFRRKYAYERRNDLSAAMYSLILAFGLGPLVADAYAYPTRILFMTSVVFCEWKKS